MHPGNLSRLKSRRVKLLEKGADPHVRASIRKGLKFMEDESVHEYREVTPVEDAEGFHHRRWVNEEAVAAIEAHLG